MILTLARQFPIIFTPHPADLANPISLSRALDGTQRENRATRRNLVNDFFVGTVKKYFTASAADARMLSRYTVISFARGNNKFQPSRSVYDIPRCSS